MALVQEVYGEHYSDEVQLARQIFAAKGLAQNIAHLQFNIRHDTQPIWEGNNMQDKAKAMIKTQVASISPDLRLDNLDKNSVIDMSMVPALIDGAVEYFRVIDYKRKKIYLFYITPTNMEQF